MMKKTLLIIGASGHGKVAADIGMKMNKWQSIKFLDDEPSQKSCLGLEVVGNSSDAMRYLDEADIFVAIGNNSTRENLQKSYLEAGASIVSLVHPNAVLGEDVDIGVGTVIMAGVIINSASIIGKGCIINTGATLDHDNTIGDYAHISPGVNLAGAVSVGDRTWIGIGSVVSNNVNICSGCKLGAGTVVVKDITEAGTYVGALARRV
jgi:sugar O-acyltransferase (sialic acid O-acetyltransferase NeuD family)